MQREPLSRVASRSFVLRESNIDTDQIIPARFLTTTERGSLGEACFHDWRFDRSGRPTDHPLNAADPAVTAILVAGANFGCGSSREHAPWALLDFGFRAVITSRAADIFKSNAAKNGLLVAEVDAEAHALLLTEPGREIIVDLTSCTVSSGNIKARFALEPFARACLLQGVDPLGFILSQDDAIAAFEQGRAA